MIRKNSVVLHGQLYSFNKKLDFSHTGMDLNFDQLYLLESPTRPLGSFLGVFDAEIWSNSSMKEIQGPNSPSTNPQRKSSVGHSATRNP